MDGTLLIYGSYGYTGSLIARTAVDTGHEPILAGRRAEPLEEQATELGLDNHAFSLTHPSIVELALSDVDAVLNCAGPFSQTADPLLQACLASGTHYLDIAGNIDILESIAARDQEGEQAAVTVLPAVGFDVVPTDCLAALLHAELVDADRLTLALDGLGTFSPGTVKSIVENFHRPGAIRETGAIRTVPAAWKTREFDFGFGVETGVTVPWGTISTAYYSTEIETIETYATLPLVAVRAMERGRPLTPVLGFGPLQSVLKAAADRLVSGPTPDERAQSSTQLWGEVQTNDGDRAVARLTTPDTYDLTAATAVESARRVLADETRPGFQTPVTAFGADYITEFNGVTLEHTETA